MFEQLAELVWTGHDIYYLHTFEINVHIQFNSH